MAESPTTSKCRTCPGGCATDADAGFHVSEEFEKFSQKDEIFSRR